MDEYLRASDGTGIAALAHVTAPRSIGSDVIEVDNTDNWPANFIATSGTPDANGYIDPNLGPVTEMTAHLNAGDIIIDGFEPGSTDEGNTTDEIIVVKQTAGWADRVAERLEEIDSSHTEDVQTRSDENVFDHIASGCVLTGTGYGSTLAWSLTEGVVYINGRRLIVAAAAGVVAASKDTYFDLLDNGDGTVSLVYTGGNSVANNAASPILADNSVRLGIITSGANIANIAAINQGQEDKVLPIASSVPYTTTDSLGNLICPRDPQRRTLGFRRIVVDFGTASSTIQQVTGLSCPVKVPLGRKIKIRFHGQFVNDTSGNYLVASLWDGAVNSGAQIDDISFLAPASTATVPGSLQAKSTPAAASKTYNVGLKSNNNTNNVHIQGAPTHPAFIEVMLD